MDYYNSFTLPDLKKLHKTKSKYTKSELWDIVDLSLENLNTSLNKSDLIRIAKKILKQQGLNQSQAYHLLSFPLLIPLWTKTTTKTTKKTTTKTKTSIKIFLYQKKI
jgi:hypothetical protein